jgi:hypothetical protein
MNRKVKVSIAHMDLNCHCMCFCLCFLSSSPDTTFLYLKDEFLSINCRLL